MNDLIITIATSTVVVYCWVVSFINKHILEAFKLNNYVIVMCHGKSECTYRQLHYTAITHT